MNPAPPGIDPSWVRLAVGLSVAAHSVVFAYDLWADFDNHLARLAQLGTWLMVVVGLLMVRRHPRAACTSCWPQSGVS